MKTKAWAKSGITFGIKSIAIEVFLKKKGGEFFVSPTILNNVKNLYTLTNYLHLITNILGFSLSSLFFIVIPFFFLL